jgi:hypothetical protein
MAGKNEERFEIAPE